MVALTDDNRFSRVLEGPMIDVTHTVTIDRPVSEVFDFVAESSNEPKWDVDVQEVVQPTQGPLTAGTRYEWVLKLLGIKRSRVRSPPLSRTD
jgi:ligand-binding SRPBCC domain-containing protein